MWVLREARLARGSPATDSSPVEKLAAESFGEGATVKRKFVCRSLAAGSSK
jgi:hypothetical protein